MKISYKHDELRSPRGVHNADEHAGREAKVPSGKGSQREACADPCGCDLGRIRVLGRAIPRTDPLGRVKRRTCGARRGRSSFRAGRMGGAQGEPETVKRDIYSGTVHIEFGVVWVPL